MVRNESIDVIKGFLIITVIVGHILLGTLDEKALRYFIYSFHMPSFFFISGYLLNLNELSQSTPRKLLSKYWQRLLFPWAIALLVYSLYNSIEFFSINEFLNQLVHPFYHLWYIPTLFVFIVITSII